MEGYIYCLSNESMPGLLKIGMTRRTPENRVKELHTTGVPSIFKIEYSRKVNKPKEIERMIHKELKHFRVKDNREFFKISTSDAISLFNRVIPESNLNTQDANFIKMTEDIKTNIFQLINNYTNNKEALVKDIDDVMNIIFNKYCNEKTEKNINILEKINDKNKYQILQLLREFGGRNNTIKAIDNIVSNTIVNEELEFINKINNIGIGEIIKEYNINETARILWYNVFDNTIIIHNLDNIHICDKQYADSINIIYVSYNIFKKHILKHFSDHMRHVYREMYYKCLQYCRSELALSSPDFDNLIKIGIFNDDTYILTNSIIEKYILDDN
jgi:hypothetical protein